MEDCRAESRAEQAGMCEEQRSLSRCRDRLFRFV